MMSSLMELSLLLSRGSFMGTLRGKVQPRESWCGQTGKEFLEKSSGIRLSKDLLKERRRKERKEERKKKGKKERKERKKKEGRILKERILKKLNFISRFGVKGVYRTVTCSELSSNYTGYN